MNGRKRVQSLAASPVMVGAVTVLVATVAVFLAYQANTGLPFVPTYRVSVLVPNADTVVPNNEVRIGGVQVGTVEGVEAVQNGSSTGSTSTGTDEEVTYATGEAGTYSARLDLKLNRSVAPLPVDSTVLIRAKSALGLKYIEVTPGESQEGYPEGATIPLSQARPEP
ncbi:MAG: MlaD family protein, partial [bacterium]